MRTFIFVILLFSNVQLFSQEKIFYCMNDSGQLLFSIKAYSVGMYYDGFAQVDKMVKRNGKYVYQTGFVDITGKMVIQANYVRAHNFKYGVTWVQDPDVNRYYLIDKTGKRLTNQSWSKVGYFFEGFCSVFDDNDRMGFVNRKGELIIPCKYLGTDFSEGLACVMPYESPEEKYGFIDTNGVVVIPFQFKQPGYSSFANGECRVVINGTTCLINHKGEVVFKPTLTRNSQGFTDGLSASYTNYNTRSGWGFYNRKNEWVIQPQYDYADPFENGLALVEKNGKRGIIDTTGKIIIPIKYSSVYSDPYDDGYFTLELEPNGERVYVRIDGTPFTSVSIKYLLPANGHSILPFITADKKYGFLKKDGTLFLPATFDYAYSFREHKTWIRGDVSSLPMAPGITSSSFVVEFNVGDKVYGNWKNGGKWYPGTITKITEYYYLVAYDDGDQEWVIFDQLKKR